MNRLVWLLILGSAAATAQVSGPLVSGPAHMAVSETIAVIASQGRADAFGVQEIGRTRESNLRKDMQSGLQGAKSDAVAANVSVPANTPYAQTATYQPLGVALGVSFEGLGLGTPGFVIGSIPPEPTIGVSPTQVVQWVNSVFAVYDKAGNRLLPAPGFLNSNAIWQGLPANSLCRMSFGFNPVVQYDRVAQRWILSQTAFEDDFRRNSQCIAVSTTSNALGSYALYDYNFGTSYPDDSRLGVWPNAYFWTYDTFEAGRLFTGARACAYDRAAMIAGLPAMQICFNDPQRNALQPADLDGTNLPPAGAPNYLMSLDFGFPHSLELIKFAPDFITPANSTFDDGLGGGPFSAVAFRMDANSRSACNDGNPSGPLFNVYECVPQRGTTQPLFSFGDRLMSRLVYRNFGTHDALLFTQAIDDSAGNNAHLRWWEIRRPGAALPEVYQNSTYRPTNEARWSGSAAFDKLGNIAIGYSVSSASIYPSIRIAGRRKSDPKNLLRAEVSVKTGTGSQTRNSAWRDSTMQIDPSDDCTFWYTQEYIFTTGDANWATRIASFKFPNCN
ncbi:MAG: hypothetical protein ACKVOX_07480 [Rhizobacter sp.]